MRLLANQNWFYHSISHEVAIAAEKQSGQALLLDKKPDGIALLPSGRYRHVDHPRTGKRSRQRSDRDLIEAFILRRGRDYGLRRIHYIERNIAHGSRNRRRFCPAHPRAQCNQVNAATAHVQRDGS